MTAISGIEPAAAPSGAQTREQKGRTAAEPPREAARARANALARREPGARAGMLVDVKV